jgi:hypothetical protein
MDRWEDARPRHRTIFAFHQDDQGDWVAELACGHTQHLRHNPPWIERPWVITAEGRQGHLGGTLDCRQCQVAEQSRGETTMADSCHDSASGDASAYEPGGDA